MDLKIIQLNVTGLKARLKELKNLTVDLDMDVIVPSKKRLRIRSKGRLAIVIKENNKHGEIKLNSKTNIQ